MVGAGFGGVSIISAINQWKIRKNIELTLVEPAEWLHYRNDWVKHSILYLKTTSFPVHIADLIPSDTINWINEPAAQFNPDKNHLLTINGTQVDYDILIIASGLQPNWDLIEGIHGKLGRDFITTAFNYSSIDWNKRFFNEIDGGKVIFTLYGGESNGVIPSKEIALILTALLKQKKIREKFQILYNDGNQHLFPNLSIRKSFSSIFDEENITYRLSTNLLKVYPKNREAVFYDSFKDEEYTEKYDLLHIAPKMSPSKSIMQSELSDKNGFLAVDKTTLQHKNYDNVFGIGDVTNVPCVKNISVVKSQLSVVLANISTAITGLNDLEEFNGAHSFSLYSTPFKRSNFRLKFLELDESKMLPAITTKSMLGYLISEKSDPKNYKNLLTKPLVKKLQSSTVS